MLGLWPNVTSCRDSRRTTGVGLTGAPRTTLGALRDKELARLRIRPGAEDSTPGMQASAATALLVLDEFAAAATDLGRWFGARLGEGREEGGVGIGGEHHPVGVEAGRFAGAPQRGVECVLAVAFAIAAVAHLQRVARREDRRHRAGVRGGTERAKCEP